VSDGEIDIKQSFTGGKFKIIHCKGAKESFREALSHVSSKKAKSFTRGMTLQIQRLADGQRMSKENFPQEGELPKRVGQIKSKKFNALKRVPIRGYCWLSERCTDTYFISHYTYKNYSKLKQRDINIISANWRRIEVDNDEF